VTLFTFAAKQHFDSRQDARSRLSIATLAQQFVLTAEQLRFEWARVDAARGTDGQVGPSDLGQIAQFHRHSETALATIAALLEAENGAIASPERARLAQMQLRYETSYGRMMDVLHRPAP